MPTLESLQEQINDLITKFEDHQRADIVDANSDRLKKNIINIVKYVRSIVVDCKKELDKCD